MMNNMMFNNNNNNPMQMNNMGVNPMGPMGLNNQPNLMNDMIMDQTALNVKNIVEPYEKRIRELEEIIKQKDFEIAVLKQKLNKNNLNNNNFMNMNQINMRKMNPVLPMNMMISDDEEILKKDKIIKIIIQLNNNEKKEIECFENDKASILREKCNINDGHFFFNYKLIRNDLSLIANGIFNDYSTINVKNKLFNLHFSEVRGKKILLFLSDDCPLDVAIDFYLIKQGDPFILQKFLNGDIDFLYNAQKLEITDKTPINKIFHSFANITVAEREILK